MKLNEWWLEEGIYKDKIDGKLVKLHRDYEDAWNDEFESLYYTKNGSVINIQNYGSKYWALLKNQLEYVGKL